MQLITMFLVPFAVALFASIGHAHEFDKARQLAALHRRQSSQGHDAKGDFEAFKRNALGDHNKARADYGPAPTVTWSDELYPDTQAYAEQCKFQHSEYQGKYGECLAAGEGEFSFDDGFKMWMDEASEYDYNHPGFSHETGHFTEVVWKNVKQVACGMAKCPPGSIFEGETMYIVCRYTPYGNVEGEYEENVGRPVNH